MQRCYAPGGTAARDRTAGRSLAGMLDRLTAQDAINLRTEDRGAAMHVAGLAILDGGSLLEATGALRLHALRENVERRLHMMPRLRQALHVPPTGQGPPVWVDVPDFDVASHVRTRAVADPAAEAAPVGLFLGWTGPALARWGPLGELWLLPGLAERRVGMLIRLHHVVADGVAAIAMLSPLFDATPDASAPDPPAWS